MKYTVMVTAASLAAMLSGCTSTEVKETGSNLVGAAGDAVRDLAADPTKVATPAGLAVLASAAAVGFFSRQSVSVTKWMGSKTAGPFVKLLSKLFGKGE